MVGQEVEGVVIDDSVADRLIARLLEEEHPYATITFGGTPYSARQLAEEIRKRTDVGRKVYEQNLETFED